MTDSGDDNVVLVSGSSNATCLTTPAHYCGIRCKSSFKYFVPTNNVPPFAVEVLFHALYKITLKAMLIFKAFFFDHFLAKCRLLPCVFRTLIATYMNIFG